MALLIDFILQITAFIGLMTLNIKCQEKKKFDILCCFGSSLKKPSIWQQVMILITGALSDDVILLSSPPTFDPHIIDMFLAVVSGATLLIRPRRQLTTGDVTLETVTILHCTPSLLQRLASAPRLWVLGVGGERCSAEARRRLTEHLEAGESKEMVARMSTTTTTKTCLPSFTTRS